MLRASFQEKSIMKRQQMILGICKRKEGMSINA